MKSLMITAYWPNLHYFCYVLQSDTVLIEQFENFQKQSYRNRCQILSANGPLDLSIPVKKKAPKELSKDIEISYAEAWHVKHWRAITSAYRNSPYFEHFESEIRPLYDRKYERLLEFNLLQLHALLRILKQNKEILLTGQYEKSPLHVTDVRETIHPKVHYMNDPSWLETLKQPYYQTFQDKFSFVPNLSILDLVFNTGLGTSDYLEKK